jgi:multidrug efflux pump subunit AcrB
MQAVISLYIQKESVANTINTAGETVKVIDKLRGEINPNIVLTVVKMMYEDLNKLVNQA